MQNSYYFSLSHQVKLLWSADFQIPEVADAMTLSRFEDIKGFVNNMSQSCDDKIKKINDSWFFLWSWWIRI